MLTQVLVVVTTHNNILSTNFVRGLYKTHSQYLTPDDSRGIFQFFFLRTKNIHLHCDSFIWPQGSTHFNPPPEGILRFCAVTHFLQWGFVGYISALNRPNNSPPSHVSTPPRYSHVKIHDTFHDYWVFIHVCTSGIHLFFPLSLSLYMYISQST